MNLSAEQVRTLRTSAQRLQPRAPREALIEAVGSVVGIQAQSEPAMMLALRARVNGLTISDVTEAIRDRRSLVRTWTMRGTLHLSTTEDARWLVALLGPAFIPGGKRRRLELGLDDEISARGLKEIRAILRERGALTRTELIVELNARGVALERKGQAPIHLIALAALHGIVCYGAETQNGEETFVLFEEWAGRLDARPKDAAQAELARRYLKGYGPASLRDFAGWSGLTIAAARKAWNSISAEQDFAEAQVGNLALQLIASNFKKLSEQSDAGPVVRLLPAFDTYILGYSNRDLVVHPDYQSEVYHGGQTVPVVLVNGDAVGVWRYKRQRKKLAVTVHAFNSFEPEVRHLIVQEADDIGRFWDMPVSLSIER